MKFVLIPIENTEKHLEHYESICEDFKRCDLKVDRACSNVARTRSIAFDEGAYMNGQAQVYTRFKEIKQYYPKEKNSSYTFDNSQNVNKIQSILSWIDRFKIDITGKERQWYEIGSDLAHELGEDGCKVFHEVSKYYPKCSVKETNYKFNHCLKRPSYTIGTFIHYAQIKGWRML